MLEAVAGPGGINHQAYNLLNEDNHCEILKYTCLDVNGYWGTKDQGQASAPNMQFKVRPKQFSCSQSHLFLSTGTLLVAAHLQDHLPHDVWRFLRRCAHS